MTKQDLQYLLMQAPTSWAIIANIKADGIELKGHWNGNVETSKLVLGLSIDDAILIGRALGETHILYKFRDEDKISLYNVNPKNRVLLYGNLSFDITKEDTCYSEIDGLKFKFTNK
jgi:hypothetical protein